jgi:hypothetical protein
MIPTSIPTIIPTIPAQYTPTTPIPLETLPDRDISETDLPGKVQVDYPLSVRANSTGYVKVAIALADAMVSLESGYIPKLIPPDATPVIDQLVTDQAYIPIREVMRVQVGSSAFDITHPESHTREINTDVIGKSVVWVWSIDANKPDRVGKQSFLVSIFRGDELVPVWQRSYQTEIVGTNLTSASDSSSSTAPLYNSPINIALVGACATIIAALIGLIGVFIARDRLPISTKGGKKRSLQNQISKLMRRKQLLEERKAQQGISTDPAVITEIEDLEAQIATLEEKLQNLENDD